MIEPGCHKEWVSGGVIGRGVVGSPMIGQGTPAIAAAVSPNVPPVGVYARCFYCSSLSLLLPLFTVGWKDFALLFYLDIGLLSRVFRWFE